MKSKNIENLLFLGLFLFVLTIICIAFWNFFNTLNAIETSTSCDKDYVAKNLHRLQSKVFDGSVVTFSISIIVSLLVTIGIYQTNKSREILYGHKKQLNQYKDYLITSRNERESMSLAAKFYPSIVSIYVISLIQTDKNENTKTKKKANEILNSLCYNINRHLNVVEPLAKNLKSIDNENKEILTHYLGETLYNIKCYIENNELESEYADSIIDKIENIMEQIKKLKILDFEDSNHDIYKIQQ